jgi:hypothetical protein
VVPQDVDAPTAAHLATCEDCAATVGELVAALAALRRDALPEPPAYPEVRLPYLRPVAPAPVGPAARPAEPRRFLLGGALAVLAAALGWALWLAGQEKPLVGEGPTPAAVPTRAAPTRPPASAPAVVASVAPAASALPATPAPSPAASGTAAPSLTVPPSAPPTEAAPVQAIVLLAPDLLSAQSGLLRFRWTAPPLPPGAVFDVRVCRGAGCLPGAGRTNVAEPGWVWCPDEGAGRYRWRVVPIDAASKEPLAAASELGEFDWSGGECEKPVSTSVPTLDTG